MISLFGSKVGQEELDEIKDSGTIEECADVLILFMQTIDRLGYTWQQLLHAVAEKHEINKARQWGTSDENGVINHVSEE